MIPSNLVVSTLLNHLSICEQVLDKSKSGHEIAVCVWGAKLYNHQSLGVDQALKNAENADIAFHAPLLHFISRETERAIAKAQFEQLPECHRVTKHGWSMLGNRYALQNKSFWWISIIQMLCVFLLVDIFLWFHMTPERRPALFGSSRFHNQY